MSTTTPKLIIALDYRAAEPALALAQQLIDQQPWLKVGLELLMNSGPQLVKELRAQGFPVFLDGKFHDIPNTVAGAIRGATSTGANMCNVHAAGGIRMMQAARDAALATATELNLPPPLVIAVTVLTSISAEELRAEVGCNLSPEEQAIALALRAHEAGLAGVVASVWETAAIKKACGDDFLVITPGIRPNSGSEDDQRRVATPANAISAGADFLVVGRPVTQAKDPAAACREILAEMKKCTKATS